MKPVYEAHTLHEAQLLVDLLQERSIPTYVRNSYLQGALGELPMTLSPIVCVVDDRDWAAARRIADDFEAAARAEPGPDRHCPHCGESSPGNFQVCWKCRTSFELHS